MTRAFGSYQDEGNKILLELAEELGCPKDTKRAAYVLKAVLVGLRKRLNFENALELLQALPFPLKVIFLNGWNTDEHGHEKSIDLDEFINEVRHYDTYMMDMVDKEKTVNSIMAVSKVVSEHGTEGMKNKVFEFLPKGLEESGNARQIHSV